MTELRIGAVLSHDLVKSDTQKFDIAIEFLPGRLYIAVRKQHAGHWRVCDRDDPYIAAVCDILPSMVPVREYSNIYTIDEMDLLFVNLLHEF